MPISHTITPILWLIGIKQFDHRKRAGFIGAVRVPNSSWNTPVNITIYNWNPIRLANKSPGRANANIHHNRQSTMYTIQIAGHRTFFVVFAFVIRIRTDPHHSVCLRLLLSILSTRRAERSAECEFEMCTTPKYASVRRSIVQLVHRIRHTRLDTIRAAIDSHNTR